MNDVTNNIIDAQANPAPEVNFMDFGAKRHTLGDVDPEVHAKKSRLPLDFRLIKEWYLKEHTWKSYIGWGIAALFIGIAIASFLTQVVLFAVDSVGGGVVSKTVAINQVQGSSSRMREHLGSDDGAYAQASSTPLQQYKLANIDKLPVLSAKSYMVADIETGEILLENNEEFISPMASVSKLMTAVIAHEQMNPQTVAIVSRDSYGTYGSEGNLVLGEKIRLVDLMYPLLIESSNDGAEVIADAYPGGHTKFLEELNKKAIALGMHDTYYEDPSGLSPKNVSSIHDLLKLARYITQKAPILWDMTRVRQYAILGHTWVNRNGLLQYGSFVGGKNGFIDEAKQTTVSIFDTELYKGGKRPLVVIILKSNDKNGDVAKLLAFVKKNGYYTPADAVEATVAREEEAKEQEVIEEVTSLKPDPLPPRASQEGTSIRVP